MLYLETPFVNDYTFVSFHSSPSPSVPYIGPYLNQLVSIEVGMPTFVRDPPEHVNFSKLSKVNSVGQST